MLPKKKKPTVTVVENKEKGNKKKTRRVVRNTAQDTKRFCINFLASYILLSLQLVVMTVVYAMFRTSFAAYLASAASITSFSWKGFFTGGIFMIIYAVIMVKSDRLFDKVLH